MAQEIPTDLTGGWWHATQRVEKLSPSFNLTIPTVNGNTSNLIDTESDFTGRIDAAWFADDPILGVVHGCPTTGTCKASVRAPALAVTSCISHVLPVNYWQPVKAPENILAITAVAPPLSSFSFLIDISFILDEKEHINLITGYGRSDNCTGTFNYTICTLDSAIGEYDVSVNGDKLELAPSLPHIIALANNTRTSHDWDAGKQYYPSTLAGIKSYALEKWGSAVNCYYRDGGVHYAGYAPNIYRAFTDLDTSKQCTWSYGDPQTAVLHDLNKLMFMTGGGAASGSLGPTTSTVASVRSHMDPNLPIETTTKGYIQGSHEVFRTNLRWFGAAAVIELVCIALILPTYFGWWRFGRSVSLSPLETAKVWHLIAIPMFRVRES